VRKKSSLLLPDLINYEDLTKEAFLGALAGAGKLLWRNKGMALATAMNGMDIAGAASKAGGAGKRTSDLARMVQTPPINM
jgi:hypothetical protein